MPRKVQKKRLSRSKSSNTSSLPKYKQAIKSCHSCILEGRLLAIDPSTGSKSSMPGFAVFEKGILKESGTIEVDYTGNRAERLFEINRTLREEFETPDVVVCEDVKNRTFFNKKGGFRMSTSSMASLQRSIGAIIAAHPVKCLIEIPNNSWQAHTFPGYIKSDENDAISIGLCAINIAKEFI